MNRPDNKFRPRPAANPWQKKDWQKRPVVEESDPRTDRKNQRLERLEAKRAERERRRYD